MWGNKLLRDRVSELEREVKLLLAERRKMLCANGDHAEPKIKTYDDGDVIIRCSSCEVSLGRVNIAKKG